MPQKGNAAKRDAVCTAIALMSLHQAEMIANTAQHGRKAHEFHKKAAVSKGLYLLVFGGQHNLDVAFASSLAPGRCQQLLASLCLTELSSSMSLTGC